MKNINSRRDFIKNSALASAGIIVGSSIIHNVFASEVKEETTNSLHSLTHGSFSLPNLAYNYDALEPHLDKMTMEIHHSKHHKAYVDNLNTAIHYLEGEAKSYSHSLFTIFENITKFPEVIRNNAGGHYNHSLFWMLLTPNAGGIPKGNLANAITTTFGSFETFKLAFGEAAKSRFGSGWAWLVVKEGKLEIGSTANQDNPLMKFENNSLKGKPILALDVWEHAYYLKNQNRRADYINSFWKVVNWDKAEEFFNQN